MEWDSNTISFDFSAVAAAAGTYIENAFYNSKYKASISRLKREAKASANVSKNYDGEMMTYQLLASRKDLDRISKDKEQMKKEISELITSLKELEKEIAKSDKKIQSTIKKHSDEIYKNVDILVLCQFEKLHETFYHDEIVNIINGIKESDIKKLTFENIKYIFKSLDHDITGINPDKSNILYKLARDSFIRYIGHVTDKNLFEEQFKQRIIDEAKQVTGMPEEFIKDITNKFDSIRVLYSMKNSE